MESILISSKNRISGTTSDCIIKSNNLLQGTYRVSNIIITNTIYLVDGFRNNSFKINGTTFYINTGSYDINSLVTTIQNALNTSFGTNAYNIGVNTVTGKVSLLNASNTNFTIEFYNGLNIVLGYQYTNYTGGTSYTGEEIIDVLHLSLGIKINESDSTNIYNFADSGIQGTLYFPFGTNFGNTRELKYSDLPQKLHFPYCVNTITISFLDLTNGRKIDLNGSDWLILLTKIC